jgi:acyl carrier protein
MKWFRRQPLPTEDCKLPTVPSPLAHFPFFYYFCENLILNREPVMMEKTAFAKKINTLLAEEFEIEESLIEPAKALMQTLHLDSLDRLDLVVLIEKHFRFKFTNKDFANITTFQSFYDYLYDKLKTTEV